MRLPEQRLSVFLTFNGNAEETMCFYEPKLHMRKCAWVTDRFGVTCQPVWE